MNTNRDASVLIVEDEYMNAWSLAVCLKPYFQVRHAATTEEAQYWLNREKFMFIMMDIRIGHDSRAGFRLLEEARKIIPDVIVFATTGMGMGKDSELFLEAGFHSYYPKPVNEQEILAEMLHLADNWRAA